MKVGTVVKLKGQPESPTMTVAFSYRKLQKAVCYWFIDSHLNKATFGFDALVLASK